MTLPDLSSEIAVDPARVRELREKGHTCVRSLASAAEVAAFRDELERVALEGALDKRPLAERDTYGRAFLQTHNLWLASATARAFVLSRRFARVAAELLGVPAVRLYHDQALFKEAGGGPTPWHQDQFYWPLDTDRTLTLWMPLVDVPAEVGSVTFASGSHVLGHLGEHAIGDVSQRVFTDLIAEQNLREETHGEMAAGDATFHTGWTLHRAGPNPTDRLRSVMTIIYFADGTRVAPLDHPMRRVDHALYLPECGPGSPITSRFTPRLHPRDAEIATPAPRTEAERSLLVDALRSAGLLTALSRARS